MDTLNYHHLRYFWVVAREGGLSAAARALRLSHPTLSTQIQALEDALGQPLFDRVGRKLVLTEKGRVVYRFADEIFSLGRELIETVSGGGDERRQRLQVGITDVVPKLVARRLLEPVLTLPQPVRMVCREDHHDRLLADLALHAVDVVLSDAPVAPGSPVRAYHHKLGQTSVSFFGTRELVKAHGRGFPASLDGAPMLLPVDDLEQRRALDAWFRRKRVRPRVVAEFADSAMLKAFGADGFGVFTAPSAVEREVCAQYGVKVLGRAPELPMGFYAITAERKLHHPAVIALTQRARQDLFA